MRKQSSLLPRDSAWPPCDKGLFGVDFQVEKEVNSPSVMHEFTFFMKLELGNLI